MSSWESHLLHIPSLFLPPSPAALWQCLTQLGKLCAYLHAFIFSSQRSHRLKSSILPLSCTFLGGSGKIKPFLCSPVHPNSYFFLQLFIRTFHLETWTSIKVLLSMVDCQRQCFPKVLRPWPRVAGASSWVTAGFIAGTEIGMPITLCMSEWDSSWIPCLWCWIL